MHKHGLNVQKCARASAAQRGLLNKLCGLMTWCYDEDCCDEDLHKTSMALMISLLGPGDVPEALDKVLKHNLVFIVVRSCFSIFFVVVETCDGLLLLMTSIKKEARSP